MARAARACAPARGARGNFKVQRSLCAIPVAVAAKITQTPSDTCERGIKRWLTRVVCLGRAAAVAAAAATTPCHLVCLDALGGGVLQMLRSNMRRCARQERQRGDEAGKVSKRRWRRRSGNVSGLLLSSAL